MTHIQMNFYQRVMIWNLIGAHKVPRMLEAAPFLRVIEKVRLMDEEVTQSQYINDDGRISWQLPESGYGSKAIELEQEEIKAIASAAEQSQIPILVRDAEWINHLIDKSTTHSSPSIEAAK